MADKKRRRSPIMIALLVVAAVISLVCGYVLFQSGSFSELVERELACQTAFEVSGVEDVVMLSDRELLFLTGDRIRAVYDEKPIAPQILRWRYDRHSEPVLLSTGALDFPFRPLYLAVGATAEPAHQAVRILIVNYRNDRSYIEHFELQENQLVHMHSQTHEFIQYPGAVVALSADRFLVLNEFGLYTPIGHMIEDALSLPKSYIAECNLQGCKRVLDGLVHATSMALSSDAQLLYVVEQGQKSLSIFRDNGGSWTKVVTHRLTSTPDQIRSAPGGMLLTSHPNGLSLRSHRLDPRHVVSPSEVYRLEAKDSGVNGRQVVPLWVSQGEMLSAGRQALAVSQSLMIVAAPFSERVVRCQLSSDTRS